MEIRCPHCHSLVTIANSTSWTDVPCSSCGSRFSITSGVETTANWTSGDQKLGHFHLIRRLGLGGFGEVWYARDTELDRFVAIKVPRTGSLYEPETFLREARAAAQLSHPGIVRVHEIGQDDGRIFIVSEYVEGITLADQLEQGPLDARAAAEICRQVAVALEHAHEAGVVHRDLKPSNIMLDRLGEPHVMDFGLAKRDVEELTMTVEGQVLGTPAYMSPEQARGDSHAANERSDIYSLGVVLFESLTGERPFRGNQRMLLHQVLHQEPPTARSLNSNISRDLDTICQHCLQKDPGRRYVDARSLSDDLQRYLDGAPIHARPAGRIERLVRWSMRNRMVASLLSVSMLLLLGIASITSIAYFRELQLRQQADEALVRERKALRGERAANDRLKLEKQNVLQSRDKAQKLQAQAERQANRLLIGSLSQEASRNANRSLSLLLGAEAMERQVDSGLPADGHLRHLLRKHVLTGKPQSLVPSISSPGPSYRLINPISRAQISLVEVLNDNTVLRTNGDGAFYLDSPNRDQASVVEGRWGGITHCTWSPDGGWLVAATQGGKILVWNTSTGEVDEEPVEVEHVGAIRQLMFTRGSTANPRLIVLSADNTLRFFSSSDSNWTLSGRLSIELDRGSTVAGMEQPIRLSPDRRWLYWNSDTKVHTLDCSRANPAESLQGTFLDGVVRTSCTTSKGDIYSIILPGPSSQQRPPRVAWVSRMSSNPTTFPAKFQDSDRFAVNATLELSADEDWLLLGRKFGRPSHPGTVAILNVGKGESNWRALAEDAIGSSSLSNDGKHLAIVTSNQDTTVWRFESEWNQIPVEACEPLEVHTLEFSPNANWLFATSKDGVVQSWNRDTHGQYKTRFRWSAGPSPFLAVSPDNLHVCVSSVNRTRIIPLTDTPTPPKLHPGNIQRDTAAEAGFYDGCILLYQRDLHRPLMSLALCPLAGGPALSTQFPKVSNDRLQARLSPNNRSIAIVVDGSIYMWTPWSASESPQRLWTADMVATTAIGADQQWLAAGYANGNIVLRDLREREFRASMLAAHRDIVTALVYTQDGKLLSGSQDGTIKLWSAPTAESPDRELIASHKVSPVISIQFGPHTQTALVNTNSGLFALNCLHPATPPSRIEDRVVESQFSTSERWIAIRNSAQDFFVYPVPPQSNHAVKFHVDDIFSGWDTSDEWLCVTTWRNGEVIVQSADGKKRMQLTSHDSPCACRFIKGGKELVVWSSTRIEIWTTGKWQSPLKAWDLDILGHSVQMSVDEHWMGFLYYNESRAARAQCLDLETRSLRPLRFPSEANQFVAEFAFAHTRPWLVTYGRTQTTSPMFHDLTDSHAAIELPDAKEVNQARFSTDDKWLEVAQPDGAVRRYSLAIDDRQLIELARQQAGRELTPAERSQYFID